MSLSTRMEKQPKTTFSQEVSITDEHIDLVQAPRGQRTIKITVRLWTDGIAPEGHVRAKHAWPHGVVTVMANQTHGIPRQPPKPFNHWNELPLAIAQALQAAGVVLEDGRP